MTEHGPDEISKTS